MKHTFKLSVPYLGKAVVVSVVSFSCAVSAYQLYQNTNIFSPSSIQAASLKNNQVVFPGQDKQSLDQQNKNEENYSKQKKDAKDQITPKNQSQSSFLFEQNNQLLNNNNPNLPANNPITGTQENNSTINNNQLPTASNDNTLVINPNGNSEGNNSSTTIIVPGDADKNTLDSLIPGNGDSKTGDDTDHTNDTKPGSNNNTGKEDTTTKPDPEPSNPTNEKYPDPVAKVPDVSNVINFGKLESFDKVDTENTEKKYTYTFNVLDTSSFPLLGTESSSPIYYGKELDDWTIFCNSLVFVARKDEKGLVETFYFNEMNDNIKIGSYPKTATEDFTVEISVRLNSSSPWQTFKVDYKVERSRVILLGYDDEELQSIYTDNIDGVDLRDYYDLIQEPGEVHQIFNGWSETKDGKAVDNNYLPDKKGKVVLYPTQMVDIPEQFDVELKKSAYPKETKYVLKGLNSTDIYSRIDGDIHVPEGIDEIALETPFLSAIRQMGDFYIPKSVRHISFEDYSYYVYGDFIVDKDNAYFSGEDGLLMNKDKTTLIYTANQDTIVLPETVETIENFSTFVEEIYLKNPLLIENYAAFNKDSYISLYIPEEDYLSVFKKWYGSVSNALLSQDGIDHNYHVNGGMILETLEDQTSLVGVIDSASGTLVIPESVTKIEDYAFSENDNITRIVFTNGNVELGSQILKDSSVSEVLFLSKEVPTIQEDTFEGKDNKTSIQILNESMDAFKEKWLETDKTLTLQNTKSTYKEVQGFEYIEIYYSEDEINTILINAPSEIVEFNSESISGVTINEIGEGAFSTCKQLKYVYLDENISKIGRHAFYGCEELEGIYSVSESNMTICDESLEINDGWINNLRFIAFNAKNVTFENDYSSKNNDVIYAPVDGAGYPMNAWGYDQCNKYSFKYLMDDRNGGHVLYGETRGTNDEGTLVSNPGQYYLINATTQVSGDYEMWAYTFEICTSAFENVPITNIEFHMTTDMYYIDANAFANTELSGEFELPDGLYFIGGSAFAKTKITRFIFPKVYYEGAKLSSGIFYESNDLKEIVFQNPNPLELSLYSYGTGFNFNSEAEDLKIVLQGEAEGKEKEFIESWKWMFTGVESEEDLDWYPWCSLENALDTLQKLFNYTLPEEPEPTPGDGEDTEQPESPSEELPSNPDEDDPSNDEENNPSEDSDSKEDQKNQDDNQQSDDQIVEDEGE